MATDYKALKNGGFMRQVQKDSFSLRLKVVGGNLTAEQLLTIVEISRKYGDGHVYLTSRQGVEIPFTKLSDAESVKARLKEDGVDIGACRSRVRTVTACQGSVIYPSSCTDTCTLATKTPDRYFGRELPHKFRSGIVGYQDNCPKAEEGDMGIKGGYTVGWIPGACILCGVCLKTCREGALTQTDDKIVPEGNKCTNCGHCLKTCPFDAWKGEPGYLVSFGGTFGNLIAKGRQVLPIIRDEETLFQVTDVVMTFLDKHTKSSEYSHVAINRVSQDESEAKMEAAYRG